MTNVKISKKIKRGIKIALLSATIFTMGGGAASSLVTRADDNSPIIYNGNNPKQDAIKANDGANLNQSLYITSGDQDSNYAQHSASNATPGSPNYLGAPSQPVANSIIDVGQFPTTQSNTTMVMHDNLINNTGGYILRSNNIYLPLHWKQYQKAPDSPDVVASAMPTVSFPGVSDYDLNAYVLSTTTIKYHFTNNDVVPYTDTTKLNTENPANLEYISYENSPVWQNSTVAISVPLEVTNLSSVNTKNSNGTFTISDASDSNNQNYDNLNLRFANKLSQDDVNNHFGTGKQYLLTTRDGSYKYTEASDIQAQMPTIKPIGDPNEITIDNLGLGESDSSYYSGCNFHLDPTKMSNAKNGDSVLQLLNDNGYMMPAGLNRFTWGTTYDPSNPNPHHDPNDALSLLNKNGIGNMVFQAVKVLDASDVTIKQGASFDPLSYVKVNDPGLQYQSDQPLSLADAKAKGLTFNGNVNVNKAGGYQVTYTIPVTQEGKTVTVTKKINVTVKAPTPVITGGGSITNNSTTNTNNSGNKVGNGGFDRTNSTTTQNPAVPNYAAKEGAAVYATKGVYMYKNANFKKTQRIAKYPKAKRVNRPMFVVLDYKRSANGALRYKVRDVNHGTKNAGKIGYITANRKFVVRVYYSTMPKNNKLTTIAKKGVNVYKNANLTKKVKHFKKGTRLTVKKIVKHNLTTCYQLSNGQYITGNKKLVIQGNY